MTGRVGRSDEQVTGRMRRLSERCSESRRSSARKHQPSVLLPDTDDHNNRFNNRGGKPVTMSGLRRRGKPVKLRRRLQQYAVQPRDVPA